MFFRHAKSLRVMMWKLGVETEDKEEVQGQDLENQEVSCIESENAGLKDSRGDSANDFEG
jgi:hypothetical protein